MAVLSTDIQLRYSGGAANNTPGASLGGAKSSNQVDLSALWDTVNSGESAAGDTEYRCVYVHNNSGQDFITPVIWIVSETPNYIDIGLGSSALNGTEQTVADEQTAPTSVSFSSPTSKGTGIALGTIPAGQHRAVWIRRTVPAAAGAAAATFTLRVEGDTAA